MISGTICLLATVGAAVMAARQRGASVSDLTSDLTVDLRTRVQDRVNSLVHRHDEPAGQTVEPEPSPASRVR